MSVVRSGEKWCFVDEEVFINDTYSDGGFKCGSRAYSINSQFLYDSQCPPTMSLNKSSKKRKHSEIKDPEQNELECSLFSCLNELVSTFSTIVQTLEDSNCIENNNNLGARSLQVIVENLQGVFRDHMTEDYERGDDNEALLISNEQDIDFTHVIGRLVQNRNQKLIVRKIASATYLFPPYSTFLLSSITRLEGLLNEDLAFDCIVMDPPWQNKSVKRKRLYNSLPMFDLKILPIDKLSAPNCLVIVWVTNKKKLKDYVINNLFPLWKVKFLTVWHWLKVTKKLQPVLPLPTPSESSKKPYESIVVGRYTSSSSSCIHLPNEKTIISIPSAVHSHKPPLSEILKPYLPNQPKCLELFARNLLPGWHSWGNEVFLLQNEDFFTKL